MVPGAEVGNLDQRIDLPGKNGVLRPIVAQESWLDVPGHVDTLPIAPDADGMHRDFLVARIELDRLLAFLLECRDIGAGDDNPNVSLDLPFAIESILRIRRGAYLGATVPLSGALITLTHWVFRRR